VAPLAPCTQLSWRQLPSIYMRILKAGQDKAVASRNKYQYMHVVGSACSTEWDWWEDGTMVCPKPFVSHFCIVSSCAILFFKHETHTHTHTHTNTHTHTYTYTHTHTHTHIHTHTTYTVAFSLTGHFPLNLTHHILRPVRVSKNCWQLVCCTGHQRC
jgi:hypothetical protein